MAKLYFIYFLFLFLGASQACLPEFSNQCVVNADCCSGNCERQNPDWAYGVCKQSSGGGGNCLPEWSNTCVANEDCCSKNCYRANPDWANGVCQPGGGGEGGGGDDGGSPTGT